MRAWSVTVRNEHTGETTTIVVEAESFKGAQIAAVVRAFRELKWPKSLALARSDETPDMLLDTEVYTGAAYFKAVVTAEHRRMMEKV